MAGDRIPELQTMIDAAVSELKPDVSSADAGVTFRQVLCVGVPTSPSLVSW